MVRAHENSDCSLAQLPSPTQLPTCTTTYPWAVWQPKQSATNPTALQPPTCTATEQSTVWYWRMKSGNQLAFTSGTLRSARAEAWGGEEGRGGERKGSWEGNASRTAK